MMFDYYRYSGDEAFLRERAYPFMQGAMRVYEEMLEQKDGKWSLPVSVSPEYRGSSMDAWGKNASFQLACIHRLCEDLLSASDLLGEKPRAVWKDISKNLPRACVEGEPGRDKISLWEGTELEMSHRHHSHLAGIVPFDVIDPEDRDWAGIVRRSHDNWLYRGMGLWTGWCMPWASMLHTRLGNPDMAEMILDIWQRVFTNEGHGTLHDYSVPGFSLMGSTPLRREIMQMDAGMGAVTAIQKMLLCESRGVNYLFRGAPSKWDNVSFKGMLTAGAFLVGAARSNGTVTEVKVKSLKGGVFQLANPWDGKAPVAREGGKQSLRGKILSVKIKAGETLSLKPV
jgi:hypothetical protein